MSNGCSAFNPMPAIQTLSGGFPNRPAIVIQAVLSCSQVLRAVVSLPDSQRFSGVSVKPFCNAGMDGKS
jgi:hypothetical protein